MKFIRVIWGTRERPRRDELDAQLYLFGKRSFWRWGKRV